jgi:serine/threonine protein kinase
MTNLIGQSLGRYHILAQLGEGGMATVYKAHDLRLERDVAIKVIRNDVFGSALLERMLKRFEREARALAKLSHPNIVKVLDYGEHEGAPYLVMEYLPGGTLKDKLAANRLTWEEAFRLLLPIAQALAYAHSQGIVHRDIKPSNILITQSGEPMLSDFGIAKILEGEATSELTGTGAGIGTPEYMAPEQGLGQADERADIYALGVVLYQMVTDHVPFRADTPMAVLLKKSTEPLPRPTQYVPSLPGAVENALVKALARDPENRYQTTREFVAALQNLLEGKTSATATRIPAARPAPAAAMTMLEADATPPPPPVKRSNAWMWIGAGLAAIILLVCVIGGFALASTLTSDGPANPEPTRPPETAAPLPTSTRDAAPPTEFVPPTATPTAYIPPTPLPPTATPTASISRSDPAGFARWYFNALVTDRDYDYYWNYCMTKSFQDNVTEGYNDYVSWANSMSDIEVAGVEVTYNDGHYATIRVQLTFYLKSGASASYVNKPLSYDLVWNASLDSWAFDYRK